MSRLRVIRAIAVFSRCLPRIWSPACILVAALSHGFCAAEEIAPGLSGDALIQHLRDHFRPTQPLNYRDSRRKMFREIDNRSGKVRCVYTGVEISTIDIPDHRTMNTEHTWPQSLFRKRTPMVADLHHLFATLSKPNNVRDNNPFDEIPDNEPHRWWISDTGQTQVPAPGVIDEYSESTSEEFEPREDHKGNVARAMFYMWTIYGADDIKPEFIENQKATLAAWHKQDPADAAERNRTENIKAFQGNANPFVLDATLVERVLQTSAVLLAGLNAGPADNSVKASPSLAALSGGEFSDRHRFPDFKLEYKPPENQFRDELFHLSQDFGPLDQAPDYKTDADLMKLVMNTPYDKPEHVEKYLIAVREYCLKGNKLHGADKEFSDKQYETHWNQPLKATWFHVPWQHYGEKGREGIHGLTREASAKPKQLADSQTKEYQTHAVALYNWVGGYTIGKVWQNQFAPNVNAAKFLPGTVVVKVLFTQAKEDEVPHLIDPLIWQAYIQDPTAPTDPTKRTVQKLRLLQMDVMIRDPRADKTGGWIFGTYCYNGAVGAKNKWYRLVPVGVQWGNDEKVTDWKDNKDHTQLAARKATSNSRLRETLINGSDDLPPQHLGWGGRLNGPADYYRSSCMSCHATAQYPGLEKQHPDFQSALGYEPGKPEWNHWFRNLACGEPFGSVPKKGEKEKRPSVSMDFSLQMQIGIENFYDWKGKVMGGYYTFRQDTEQPSSEPDDKPPPSIAP